MKRLISTILIMSVLSMSCNVFAVSTSPEVSKSSSYTYEEVTSYIQNALSVEERSWGNVRAVYYYGEGYTVVMDRNSYYLITYNKDNSIVTYNGSVITQFVDSSSPLILSPYSTDDEWKFFDTNETTYSVGGVAISALAAVLGGFGIGNVAVNAIVSYFVNNWVESVLPSTACITVQRDRYYSNIDYVLGIFDIKDVYTYWFGTTASAYEVKLYSYEHIWTRYS